MAATKASTLAKFGKAKAKAKASAWPMPAKPYDNEPNESWSTSDLKDLGQDALQKSHDYDQAAGAHQMASDKAKSEGNHELAAQHLEHAKAARESSARGWARHEKMSAILKKREAEGAKVADAEKAGPIAEKAASAKSTETGSRGGTFYVNAAGNKVYLKK